MKSIREKAGLKYGVKVRQLIPSKHTGSSAVIGWPNPIVIGWLEVTSSPWMTSRPHELDQETIAPAPVS